MTGDQTLSLPVLEVLANMLINFISPKTRYIVLPAVKTKDGIILRSFLLAQNRPVTDGRTDTCYS